MSLVRTKYAGELAVLSTWLAVVLPWNFVYHTSIGPAQRSTLISVRTAFLELQFILPAELLLDGDPIDVGGAIAEVLGSVHLFGPLHLSAPPLALGTFTGDLWTASLAWTVGALVLLVAVGLSVLFYQNPATIRDDLPWSPVRVLGGLLALATVTLGVSTVFFYVRRSFTGFPIPVGLIVMGMLAVTLLTVEEVEESDSDDHSEAGNGEIESRRSIEE